MHILWPTTFPEWFCSCERDELTSQSWSDKTTSQSWCDKTMDNIIALNHEQWDDSNIFYKTPDEQSYFLRFYGGRSPL